MRNYFYRAKNITGSVMQGITEANNINELINKLRNKGYYIFYYKDIKKYTNFLFENRINKLDAAMFCKQLSVILQCGIPLIEALTLLSFQTSVRQLREAISLLIIRIKSGDSLYIGLKASRYRFPEFMLQMIKIGEESGRLDSVLIELSKFFEKENKVNKKLLGSMIYPVTTFIISFIIVIMLMIFVVPSLTSVIVSMNGEIPLITSIVINGSAFVSSNILYIVLLPIIALVIAKFMGQQERDNCYKTILIELPILGKIYRRILQIRFARALSLLLNSGMNLIGSLELATNVLNNEKEQNAIGSSVREVKSGKGLHEALLSVKLFEPLFMSMIKIGEETGKLDDMLQKLTEIYEEETYETIFRISQLIQPLLIILLSLMVGIIVIAVTMPMMNIIDII